MRVLLGMEKHWCQYDRMWTWLFIAKQVIFELFTKGRNYKFHIVHSCGTNGFCYLPGMCSCNPGYMYDPTVDVNDCVLIPSTTTEISSTTEYVFANETINSFAYHNSLLPRYPIHPIPNHLQINSFILKLSLLSRVFSRITEWLVHHIPCTI